MKFPSRPALRTAAIGLGILVLFTASGAVVYSMYQGRQAAPAVSVGDIAQTIPPAFAPPSSDMRKIDATGSQGKDEVREFMNQVSDFIPLKSQNAYNAMRMMLSDSYLKHYVNSSKSGESVLFDWTGYGKIALPLPLYNRYTSRYVDLSQDPGYDSPFGFTSDFVIQLDNPSSENGYSIEISAVTTDDVPPGDDHALDGTPNECVFDYEDSAVAIRGADCVMKKYTLKNTQFPNWKTATVMSALHSFKENDGRGYGMRVDSAFDIYHFGKKTRVNVAFYGTVADVTGDALRKKMEADVEQIKQVIAEESIDACSYSPYGECY